MRINSCRICLSSNEGRLVELFSVNTRDNIAYKLTFCAGIEVYQGDLFPQKICGECLQKVEVACEIKEKCIETDQLLRKQFKPEPEAVEPENEIEIKVEANPDWFVAVGPEAPNYPMSMYPRDDEFRSEEETEWPELPVEVTSSAPRAPRSKPIKTPKIKSPKAPPTGDAAPSRRETRAEDYSCLFCAQIFPKIIEKKRHMKAEHANELVCRICNKKRHSVIGTENCMKDHLFGYNYLCQICARPFRRRCHLNDHIIEAHTEEQTPFTCDLCGITIRHKNSLLRHIRSVHQGEKIPCPFFDVCPGLFYSTKNSLNIHMYRQHNVPAPYSCEACGDGFTNESEVKAHQRKSCRKTPRCHSAGVGEQMTRRQPHNSLQRFYEIVNGIFHCKLCPKVYTSKLKYASHYTENHKDNKTCKICNKTFKQNAGYRAHLKTVHEKVKNFHCEHPGCGMAFARNRALISHRNTHTGEQPFLCTLCSFRTGDKQALFRHKRKMHP